MPKRSLTAEKPESKRKPAPKRPKQDENKAAFDLVQQIIRETEGTSKNPLAVALGRLGGLKGGRARADKLTEEQRSDSARHAAKARWAK